MRLYDTASREVVPFEPGDLVTMYTCGITPYDSTHLGHATAYVTYDALHDAMKRRGYIIYAGQGEIARYGFRVANMGTLVPADMARVVAAFAAGIDEVRS